MKTQRCLVWSVWFRALAVAGMLQIPEVASQEIAAPSRDAARGLGYRIGATATGPKSTVAITECGALLMARNGAEWRKVETGVQYFFRDVSFGGGQFVAVGGSYLFASGVIITSGDGENWTIRRCGMKAVFHGIAHGGGNYVIVGDEGMILTSRNGVAWQVRRVPVAGTLADVAYGNGVFAAVGDDGICITSSDAQRWVEQNTGVKCYLSSIHFDGRFVARGAKTALFSINAATWTDGTGLARAR